MIYLFFRHRAFGSAAINMVMVAQGACDAMVEYGIHAWDVAAAAVIVSEAGGCLIDPTGMNCNFFQRLKGTVNSQALPHRHFK